MSPDDLAKLDGQSVTAKRLGWDDPADDDPDRESYAEKEYTSPDLSGVLTVHPFPGGVACLVGGQEADPASVAVADPE